GARRDEAGLAALAGAKTGLFGGGCGGEEADVLARGAAAGTARAAVDSGGFDGIDKLAVSARVALEDLLPLAAGKEAGAGGRSGVVPSGLDGWEWMGHCGGPPVVDFVSRSAVAIFSRGGGVGHSAMFREVAGCLRPSSFAWSD